MFQPYPYFHRGIELWRNAGMILILSFLFEFLFEPFNVNRSEHNFIYPVIVLLHSLNGAVIYLVYFLILGLFVNDDDWKIYKEAAAIFVVFCFIGTGGYLIRELIYDNPNNASVDYWIEEVRNTILVGSMLMFGIIMLNFNFLKNRNERRAKALKSKGESISSESGFLEIKASIPSDHFVVDPEKILCVKSDGNYCEFYVLKDGEVEKWIKRISLQSTSEQLANSAFITKTHRTFLVNNLHVQGVEGNAAGYLLGLPKLNFKVPVSRAHIAAFNESMS